MNCFQIEPKHELPITRETLDKAMRLGELHVEEQRRRETDNIYRGSFNESYSISTVFI
jgi:hypothetical protein